MKRGFDIRHTYKYQSGDGITAYYEYHDGWGSSRQIIEDPYSNSRIEVDFVKTVKKEGKEVISEWKAMITIRAIDENKQMSMVPFLYIS